MKKYEPTYTSHGNYKCPYCNHKVWKSLRAAEEHIKTKHKVEAENAWNVKYQYELEQENARLKQQLSQKKKDTEYDPSIVMFCTYCKTIFRGSLPADRPIEHVRHNVCNNTTLHAVANPPIGL